MPYLAHFGLQDHPFSLTPNVDYYYPTQENTNIIASLEFALRRESGIVKIVGEVGTGKTLLCRLLINKLIETEAVAYINAPQADAQSIILTVCEEFGVSPAGDISPYAALNRFLVEEHARGRLAVVVIDEAQHLGKSGLEAIRLVSNLETERSKLLQVVMFGQTELDELLRDPALRQLNQRVVFSFSTKPLTEAETRRYVAHRLKVSRRQGVDYDIFNEEALTTIARRSGGIPRVVNIIADKSMLVAFSEGSPTVRRAHVLEAIKDTPGLVTGGGFDWTWLKACFGAFGRRAVVVSLLAALAAGVGGWFAWSATHRVVVLVEPATVSAAPAPVALPAPSQSSPQSVMSPPPAAAAVPPPLPAATAPAVTPIAADAGGDAAISPAPETASPSVATAMTKTHQGKPKRGAPRKTKSVPVSVSGDEPPPDTAAPVAPVSASPPSESGTQSPKVVTSSAATVPAAASTTGTSTSAPTAPVAAPAAAPVPVDIPVTNDAAINATLPGRPGIYGSGRGH
ncbi:ExeA family protein [Telmatospirillum siberiense]|uniref:AAA+ ATPase domain-containing protein n=1 Tax=Telmatospirillum siberiense TaxID=382514 RepID=A0A2N3Q1H8_9PROT|nr:AAA family ATPase [Telmatospirillum siberiense]PKU26512.1 hypothetical protein CWS72_01315 [Telmatospirillum siberiense]